MWAFKEFYFQIQHLCNVTRPSAYLCLGIRGQNLSAAFHWGVVCGFLHFLNSAGPPVTGRVCGLTWVMITEKDTLFTRVRYCIKVNNVPVTVNTLLLFSFSTSIMIFFHSSKVGMSPGSLLGTAGSVSVLTWTLCNSSEVQVTLGV